MKRSTCVPLAALLLVLATPAPAADIELADTRLAEVLAAQPEAVQARYGARHPEVTLRFFGIQPGMTVMEVLPGGGWYTRILLDYLGPEGTLIGADYPVDMWPLFGSFDEEAIAKKATWVKDWTAEVSQWVPGGAKVRAVQLGAVPDAVKGTADAVLFIRALHNLARFEDQGEFLTQALQDAWDALKPGGIVGIVQHEARPGMPEEFSDGSHGYLQKVFVIEKMKSLGFLYEGESDINENPADQPGPDEVVWRLPPTLMDSRDDPDARAAMEAIGESNRMTLKFRKPE